MASIKIAPSLIAADFSRLKEQVIEAEEGGADWLHLDVMDGHFVPNITFGPLIVSAVRKHTRLPLDTHLMIEYPDDYLQSFRDAGADIITVHYEACPHLHRTISRIKELGAQAGVAINPATAVENLVDILPEVNLVLIMSVNPGFGGQSFIAAATEKVRRLRKLVQNLPGEVYIEVDGGIDITSARLVTNAGATVLVAGTSIFRSGNIREAIVNLRSASG
jgi:ribulose-phosphate 3-epimerase